jgi:hypothetical protein
LAHCSKGVQGSPYTRIRNELPDDCCGHRRCCSRTIR